MRCLLLLALALPAMACLNDSEVARQDAEFRSDYGDPPSAAGAAAEPDATSTLQLAAAFAAGIGAAALIGAIRWRWRHP